MWKVVATERIQIGQCCAKSKSSSCLLTGTCSGSALRQKTSCSFRVVPGLERASSSMTATGSHVFLVAQRAQRICVRGLEFSFAQGDGLSDHNVDSGAVASRGVR